MSDGDYNISDCCLDIINEEELMQDYMPYIVSIAVAIISGIASYAAARRSSKGELEALKEEHKHDLNRLMEQHKVDIDSLERQHKMDLEKLNVEHKHQMELKDKEFEMNLSTNMIAEVMKMPEVRQKISSGFSEGKRKYR